MHDFIIENLRVKNKVLGIFIDLKKAFDSIDNEILIKKLEYYGISGPYNELIGSYLRDRNIYTFLNETKSESQFIKYGVPQGSVLGPLLFTLYINDLKNITNKFEINLFADDTSLFCISKDNNEIKTITNESLSLFSAWLIDNRLTLNLNKTHWLEFSKNKSADLSLEINGNKIKQQKSTKYLGLVVQDNLGWSEHIKTLIKKLNKQIPLYYSLREIIPETNISMLYKSLSLSLINYGIEL